MDEDLIGQRTRETGSAAQCTNHLIGQPYVTIKLT